MINEEVWIKFKVAKRARLAILIKLLLKNNNKEKIEFKSIAMSFISANLK